MSSLTLIASAAARIRGAASEGFSGTTKLTLADFGVPMDLGPASKEVELALEVEGVKQ